MPPFPRNTSAGTQAASLGPDPHYHTHHPPNGSGKDSLPRRHPPQIPSSSTSTVVHTHGWLRTVITDWQMACSVPTAGTAAVAVAVAVVGPVAVAAAVAAAVAGGQCPPLPLLRLFLLRVLHPAPAPAPSSSPLLADFSRTVIR